MTITNPTTEQRSREQEREQFEVDAYTYDFDLERFKCAAPEPWSEYKAQDTGHRWAGWLARAERSALSGQTAESGWNAGNTASHGDFSEEIAALPAQAVREIAAYLLTSASGRTRWTLLASELDTDVRAAFEADGVRIEPLCLAAAAPQKGDAT